MTNEQLRDYKYQNENYMPEICRGAIYTYLVQGLGEVVIDKQMDSNGLKETTVPILIDPELMFSNNSEYFEMVSAQVASAIVLNLTRDLQIVKSVNVEFGPSEKENKMSMLTTVLHK